MPNNQAFEPNAPADISVNDYSALAEYIKQTARDLGFQDARITTTDPGQHREHLQDWLDKDYHGEMHYMHNNRHLRFTPEELQAGAIRVISLRYDYLPKDALKAQRILQDSQRAYVSRYALGRDYHKLIRKKLAQLCQLISAHSHFDNHRGFVDSAPILERGFAEQAGLGWIGKNTMLLNARAGSWFFLGEILTNAPLPLDSPQQSSHCGSCTRCLEICPTQAFVGPWQLDARRCISYLTIENKGPIPLELRSKMGNRVFGCDDCQLVCPWNKFAQFSHDQDFSPRHQLDRAQLSELFDWSEETFLSRTAGSAIRRIGYIAWLRNLSVAMGNAAYDTSIIQSLKNKQTTNSMLSEHINWALAQQQAKATE